MMRAQSNINSIEQGKWESELDSVEIKNWQKLEIEEKSKENVEY
jgi:hypothetical protein